MSVPLKPLLSRFSLFVQAWFIIKPLNLSGRTGRAEPMDPSIRDEIDIDQIIYRVVRFSKHPWNTCHTR